MNARVEPAVGSCGHLQDLNTVRKASKMSKLYHLIY